MAFDREQIKVTVSGFLGGAPPGTEIFSWGLHFSAGTDFNATDALAELDVDGIASNIADFHSSAGIAISGDAKLLAVKFAAVGTSGDYLPGVPPRISEPNGSAGVAGIGLRRPPNQIALCITLRAATNLGVATHGRFYLPLPTFAPGPEGRIDPTAVTSSSLALVSLLDQLNTEFQAGGEPAQLMLMSQVVTGGVKSRPVTRVLVGDVLDTMQSRRESLAEYYLSADLDAI